MLRTVCRLALLASVSNCRSTRPGPATAAPKTASVEDPQTSMERRVMILASYLFQDEQEDLINRDRDRYFLSLAREAMERPERRRVRGNACRWIISYAKALGEGIEIAQSRGIWYAPDHLEPGDMARLKSYAALDADAVCPRPAVAAP